MAEEVRIVIKLIDDTGAGVRRAKESLRGLGDAGKRAGGDEGLGFLQSKMGSLGGVAAGLAAVGLTAVTVGLAAVAGAAVAATVSIVKFAASGVSMAADLEAQMSDIESLLAGVIPNADDLTTAMEGVGDAIRELGLDPSLKVNAQEAAAAIEMLVRNGMDMTEILGEVGDLSDSAARAVILLSNATGGDFAQSANIATKVMALWGDEISNINDAVDGITSVVTNSEFSINDFALALANAGGASSQLGVDFDDFNTALAAISPLFAGGAQAGTGLRAFLSTLVPITKNATEAMMELGLMTKDGTNLFFDLEGNMKSMSDVSALLAEATAGLSDEEKNLQLKTIFGRDALNAVLGLINAGIPDIETGATAFETLAESMQLTDAAELARIRMDNLAGAMEILGGVIDTIKEQVGNALLPVLTELARTVTGFVSENGPMLVSMFETLGVWLGDRLPGAANFLIDTFNNIINLFASFSGAANFLIDTFNNIINLFAGFSGGISTASSVWERSWNAISEVFMGFWDQARPILGEIGEIFGEIFGVVSEILGDVFQGVLADSGDAAATWGGIIGSAFEVALAALRLFARVLRTTLNALKRFWDKHGKDIVKIVRRIWRIIRSLVETQIRVMLRIVSAVLKLLQGDWEGAWDDIKEALEIAWEGMRTIVTAMIAIIRTVIDAWLKDLLKKFVDFVGDFINAAVGWWNDLRQGLADLISDWIRAVIGWLADTIKEFAGFISDWLSDLGSWVGDTISELTGMISDWLSEIAGWISDTLSDLAGFISDWLSDLGSWASDTISELTGMISDWLSEIAGWISDTLSDFAGFISDWLSDLGSWASDTISELTGMISDWLSEIAGWISDTLSDFAGFISDWLSDLGSWAGDTISELTGMISDWLSEIAGWISDTLSELGSMVSDWLSEISTWAGDTISELATMVSDWLSEISTWAGDTISELTTMVSDWLSEISTWAGDTISELTTMVSTWANDMATWASDTLAELTTMVSTWANDMATWASDTLAELTTMVSTWVSDMATWASDTLAELTTMVSTWASDMATWFSTTLTDLSTFITNFLASVTGWLTGSDSVISRFTAFITDFLTSFNTSWLAELVTSFGTFVTNFLVSVGEWVNGIRQKIVDTWGNVVTVLSDALTSLVNLITPGAVGSVWDTILGIGTKIVDAIKAGIAAVVDFASTVWTTIKGWLNKLVTTAGDLAAMGASIIGNIVSSLTEGTFVTDLWLKIREWLNRLSLAAGNLGAMATTLIGNIISSLTEGTFVTDLWAKIRGWLNGMVPTGGLSGFATAFKNALINALGALPGFAQDLWDAIIGFISGAGTTPLTVGVTSVGAAAAGAVDLPTLLTNLGTGIVSQLMDAINATTFLDDLKATMLNWFTLLVDEPGEVLTQLQAVGDFIVSAIEAGIVLPETLARFLTTLQDGLILATLTLIQVSETIAIAATAVGTALVTWMELGVTNQNDAFVLTVNTVINNVLAGIATFDVSFTTAGQTLMGALAGGITASSDLVVSAVRAVVKAAVAVIATFNASFVAAGRNLMSALASGVSANSGVVKKAVQSAVAAAVAAAKATLQIASPSEVFLDFGENTMQSMALGIARQAELVRGALGDVFTSLSSPSLAAPGLALPAGGVGLGAAAPVTTTIGGDTFNPVFNTTISGDIDAAQFEFMVEEALLRLSRRRGAI